MKESVPKKEKSCVISLKQIDFKPLFKRFEQHKTNQPPHTTFLVSSKLDMDSEAETRNRSEQSKRRLEKIIFWDYGPGAFDILPAETVAQRLIDRWAAIDVAYQKGEINGRDVIEALKKIDEVGIDNVIYCEPVREHVIKTMINTYIYNKK